MRIDLMQFCLKNDGIRPYLEKPFRIGNHTYATNGHVLVRVPAEDGDEPLSSGGLKLMQASLEKILAYQLDAVYAPLCVLLPPTGTRECSNCGGYGKWEAERGKFISCEDCDGAGKVEKQTSVSIAGVPFQAKYIAQIAALPEAEFPTNPINDPCPFRFAGGSGAIMPMRRTGEVDLGDLEQFRITP